MNTDSEAHKSPGEESPQEILEPSVLFLSGQSVLIEGPTQTPVYQINGDIRSLSNKASSVVLERVEHRETEPEIKTESLSANTATNRPLFYLAHPVNAQYRTDIPARYYITSAAPEMMGNIRLEASETLFQRASFKAMLSAKKTASDASLFDEDTQQLLFDVSPNKVRQGYKWNDSHGSKVAVEERDGDRRKLSIVTSVSQELRDALVATWLLKLWYDTAESKQAKRECESSFIIDP